MRPSRRQTLRLLAGAATGLLLPRRALARAEETDLEEVRTPYNHIVVTATGDIRTMYFVVDGKRVLQSRADLSRSTSLEFEVFRTMMAALLVQPRIRRVLMIGVGGGQLTNYLFERFPGLELDAVDIDAEVVRLARTYFKIPDCARYRTHAQDGRAFVERGGAWDLIILDAFRGLSVPRHLRSQEFYGACRRALAPGGVLVANLHGNQPRFVHDLTTFAASFPCCYLFEAPRSHALVASGDEQPASAYALRRHARELQARFDFDLLTLAGRYKIGTRFDRGQVVRDDVAAPGSDQDR